MLDLLINKVHHLSAERMLRLLPSNCPDVCFVVDPPFGVKHGFSVDGNVYYQCEHTTAETYGPWMQGFHKQMIRVLPVGGLLAMFQSVWWNEYYRRWYGAHTPIVCLERGYRYHPCFVLLQRKTKNGVEAVQTDKHIFLARHEAARNRFSCSKTMGVMTQVIETFTKESDIVIDNFAGSGTTALACIETGRRFILAEKYDAPYQLAKGKIEAVTS